MTQELKTKLLDPHPQNPRIQFREDVVDGIAANLKNGFDPAHALIVRPAGDRYQIISGHHRKAAAEKVGLESVPCWVREMPDEDAYMALVTSNSQGELSPLEIGMHAHETGERYQRGGGYKGYAARIGKSVQFVSQVAQAATVASKVQVDLNICHDKTQHLSAIHTLPESCWQPAVEAMLSKTLSAKETAEHVKAAKEGGTDKRISALSMGKTTMRELRRIDELRDMVAGSLNYDDLRERWIDWLDTEDPVDVKAVQAKRVELENEDHERRSAEAEAAETPKPALPQLVLADPPWKYDFAQSDSRQIENQYPSATVDEIIAHRPETEPDCVLFLWATVAKLREAFEILDGWGFEYKTHAVWDKQKIGMGYWFRGQHELLIVGTRGKVSPPEDADRVGSIFSEGRSKHSAKPECVYQWIDKAFPDLNKLEMYCRNPREGWQSHGNESGVV